MDKKIISEAFADRSKLEAARQEILNTIEALDKGQVRVAQKIDGSWQVNTWVKEAILLYFSLTSMQLWEAAPYQYRDKIPLKSQLEAAQVRNVPPGTVRYGAFMAPGSILMAGYVNIGAYVDVDTMVDTWTVVGSCAQIGANVHLSAGVVIGGVLEPAGARPVIVEKNCFIGANSVIVEGALIEEDSVIGAGVTITGSTHIIDVTKSTPITYKGYVPAHSIVIPGTRTRQFPAGNYDLPCALIIGRHESGNDSKTCLNQALRDFGEAK
ncbi:MAG: 2,3,4,5-tetrahydropyridine-2,6-dicarboxylate N-succinyltransferase [bacterium]|nr:2,3,4,5-tetrahydropyridine-2,6-dicarboxylate N-succinyltransferase [bacterium]